ncbi:MAG: hypothetical protein IJY31_03340 [Muribaculaceae bacterium]|nr:hypothetical protein [Muribaculaceae bacterium]
MRGILIDSGTGDLLVENGSIVIGDTEAQTVEAVLTTNRGEFKESPLIGGEVMQMLGGVVDVMWPGRVKKMLKACGVDCERVKVDNGEVIIE